MRDYTACAPPPSHMRALTRRTDAYWDEYMYQVVVSKDVAGEYDARIAAIIEEGVTDKTVAFPPWDPMGALA